MCEESSKTGILKFNLEDPKAVAEFMLAIKANELSVCIDDIWNKVFRPAFKHGYNSKSINDLIEKCGTYVDSDGFESSYGIELIEALYDLYREVLDEYEVY